MGPYEGRVDEQGTGHLRRLRCPAGRLRIEPPTTIPMVKTYQLGRLWQDLQLRLEEVRSIRQGWLGSRSHGVGYDFRTRNYTRPYRGMWTDAIWQQEPYKNRKYNSYPEAVRDVHGHWFQDSQHLPQFLGGGVDNELGKGIFGYHRPQGPWMI
jgi:hypothetical protein